MTMTKTPSSLLLRYFEIAQRRLQRLTESNGSDLDETKVSSLPPVQDLSWHRNRIVEAQLASLDEAIEWQQRQHGNTESSISRDSIQGVLRQIGTGDFSCVSFEGDGEMNGNGSILQSTTPLASTTGLRSRSSSRGGGSNISQQRSSGDYERNGMVADDSIREKQSILTDAVAKTNELARLAYSHSVLVYEWQHEHDQTPQYSPRELKDNGPIDEKSILEYCGLIMAAVRHSDVQRYLQNGDVAFMSPKDKSRSCSSESIESGLCNEKSVEGRLLHIQKLFWNALGWEFGYGNDQLRCLLNGENSSGLNNNTKVMETLTKYASAMTVAVTNAAMSSIEESNAQNNDDGTTRVVSVSYSEKIISMPNNSADDGNMTHSLNAPTSNTIDEHEVSQQRRELDTARATSMLQQQIWDEFQALPSTEQQNTIEKATLAHNDFLEKVANTPPGRDRILLMQSIDGEVQKLLVIYKLWCSQSNSASA